MFHACLPLPEPPLVQSGCVHSTLRTPACIPALNTFTRVALLNWELLEGRSCFLLLLFSSQHSTSTVLSNDKCLWVLYKFHCTLPQDSTLCSHTSMLAADHRPEDISIFPHTPGRVWVTGVLYLFCQSFILNWMADGYDQRFTLIPCTQLSLTAQKKLFVSTYNSAVHSILDG